MNKMQDHVCRKVVQFSSLADSSLTSRSACRWARTPKARNSSLSCQLFLYLAFVLCPDSPLLFLSSCSLLPHCLVFFPLHQSWQPLTIFQLLCGVQGVEGCQGSIRTLCCRLACSSFLMLLAVRGKEAAFAIGLLIKRARLIERTGLLECTRLQRMLCVFMNVQDNSYSSL